MQVVILSVRAIHVTTMESAWNGIQDIPVIVPILLSEDGIAEEVSRRLLLFNRGGVDLVFWL